MLSLIIATLISVQANVILNGGLEQEGAKRSLLSLRKLGDCPEAINTIKDALKGDKGSWSDACKEAKDISKALKDGTTEAEADAYCTANLDSWKSTCTSTCTQYDNVASAIATGDWSNETTTIICAYYFAYLTPNGKTCSDLVCSDIESNLASISSDCCGSSCFPPTASAMTTSGPVALGDVKIGDMVQTQAGLEPVLGFIHKSESIYSSYVAITHESDTIELSGDHMVFLADGEAILAKQVLVGDRLATAAGSSLVTGIDTTSSKGFIAPLTASGTITINGVVASTYVSPGAAPQWILHAAFAPVRALWSFMPEISGAKPRAVNVALTTA